MSGDSNYPGGLDTAYGTEAAYRAGAWNNIDGSGDDFATWMRRVESGVINLEKFGAQVIGFRSGTAVSNTSAATSLLASTITIPADYINAGSIFTFKSRGVVTINNTNTTTLGFIPKLGSVAFAMGTVPASGTWTLSSSVHQYTMEATFVFKTDGATADVEMQGEWRVSQATANAFDGSAGAAFTVMGGTTGTVNTTAPIAFDLQGQMSTANAANTIVSGATTFTYIPFVG